MKLTKQVLPFLLIIVLCVLSLAGVGLGLVKGYYCIAILQIIVGITILVLLVQVAIKEDIK